MPLGFSPSRGRPQQAQSLQGPPVGMPNISSSPISAVGATSVNSAAQTLSQGKLTPHRVGPVSHLQQPMANSMRAQASAQMSAPLQESWQTSPPAWSAGGGGLSLEL